MIGDILKELREDAELTQEELAKILNVHRTSISYYESNTNEPSLELLVKIADYFNVSTDYLLCRTKSTYIDVKITKDDFKDRFNNFIDEIWQENGINEKK